VLMHCLHPVMAAPESWPGVSRPSTCLPQRPAGLAEGGARIKSGHDDVGGQDTSGG